MEITPQIKAYFEAKKGNFDAIDNYFANEVALRTQVKMMLSKVLIIVKNGLKTKVNNIKWKQRLLK
jgi:hypothetical protein